jgi:hypothetical protein
MKKLLFLVMVLAVIAALVSPLAVLANQTGSAVINGTVTATATPVITTTPIYTTTTTVSGTNEANAAVYFTYNGGAAVLATANDSTHWSVTGLTLSTAGTNLISVIAQAGTEVDSAPALASVTAASVTLTAPTAFTWSTFAVGANAGSAATPGTVVSSGATSGWSISVADADTATNSGYMVDGTTKLTDAIQIGLAAPSAGTTTGTIATYSAALNSSAGHGQTDGTFDIPLYANQTLVTTDAPGPYTITLNYTLTASY